MDKKSRLLIVEDEAIVARDIEDVLKRLGYDVCCSVSSGEEAVEKARSFLPDLILMDIFLKGEKDGIQATEEIQGRYEIPVVYLTSYADSLTLERAKCTAPYGYLLKPFQERDLKSAVEIALCKSRSEKILREKERVFSATLFSLAEGVITADPQGNVLFLNDFAEKLLQIPFEKAKGKRLSSLFTLKRVCEGGEEEVRLLECVAGGRADFNDLLLVSSEGAKHCVDGTLTPLSGEAGFVCVLRNIEERKKAQEELQKTMEFFRLLAENGHDLILLWRWNGKTSLEYVSPSAEAITGYRVDEFFSNPKLLSLLVHPEDAKAWNDGWGKHNIPQENIFCRWIRKDGRVIWIEQHNIPVYDEHGQMTAVEGIVRDITERTEAELALRKSEAQYRRIFETSKDMIFLSTPEGRFLEINPVGIFLLGYSSKEEMMALDLNTDLYVSASDRELLRKKITYEGFVRDYETVWKRKDGQLLNVLITADAEKDSSGRVVYFRGMIRDVTEQKKLEQQLFHKQKMESIGLLAGGIAHDFNNILSGILGYASFMKMKVDHDHPFFGYIDTIEKGAQRAAELTAQLLAFAKGGRVDVKTIDLWNVIDETVKILRRTFDKRIEIITKHSERPTNIEGDRVQLQQVVMNLCVNARDAMPEGGKLTLQIEESLLEEGLEKGGHYEVLSVSDTGLGMSEEVKGRIFEPFYTTKEEGKGTGLGLSLVYGVVKNHGGFIRVESEPGRGSTFRIYLPSSDRGVEVEKEEEGEVLGGGERILVVDDEEAIREFTKAILEDYGYRVETAGDGEEGVRFYEEGWKGIDLVVLDMVMPKLGGRDVYERLRRINPEVKVVLTTGYSRNGRAREILGEGVQGFIQKPYQSKELLSVIKKVLGG